MERDEDWERTRGTMRLVGVALAVAIPVGGILVNQLSELYGDRHVWVFNTSKEQLEGHEPATLAPQFAHAFRHREGKARLTLRGPGGGARVREITVGLRATVVPTDPGACLVVVDRVNDEAKIVSKLQAADQFEVPVGSRPTLGSRSGVMQFIPVACELLDEPDAVILGNALNLEAPTRGR